MLPSYAGELCYLPTLTAKHDYWKGRENFVHLTPEVAAPAVLVAGLKDWEREQLLGIAVAWACRTAVVTGRHAARLWGIGIHGKHATGVVDLLLPGKSTPKAKAGWGEHVRYLSTALPEDEYEEVCELRLATPWRAVRDIALRESQLSALVAIDSLRHVTPGLDSEHLRKILGPQRYHGRTRVKALLELSVPNSESPLETWGREQLRLARLPEVFSVDLQVEFLAGGKKLRVDMLINGWLIVEFDGRVKYQDDPEALIKESERQHLLLNCGHPIIRVSYRNLARGEFVPMLLEALRKYPRRAA